MAYLALLLAQRIMGIDYSNQFLKTAIRFMPVDRLIKMVINKGMPDYDAAFLGFKSGRMGNQVLIQELAPLFNRRYFLYISI
jgi:hypothetical protein